MNAIITSSLYSLYSLSSPAVIRVVWVCVWNRHVWNKVDGSSWKTNECTCRLNGVLTACIRIQMLMKSSVQERLRSVNGREKRHPCIVDSTGIPKTTLHPYIISNGRHRYIISNACGQSVYISLWQFVCHSIGIVDFAKLKSCAKSANNACDISLKIPSPPPPWPHKKNKPMHWLTSATKLPNDMIPI